MVEAGSRAGWSGVGDGIVSGAANQDGWNCSRVGHDAR